MRGVALAAVIVALAATDRLGGQATAIVVLSQDARRTLALTTVGDQEFVALDELAAAFQLAVREESGAVTVTYKNRTIVLTPKQPLASISGRLVNLPASLTRSGNRWLVPVEFISRALGTVYDVKLDLRRQSRLLVVGDLRVPRVAIRHEALPNTSRVTIETTPRTSGNVLQEGTDLLVRFEADALDVVVPSIQAPGIVEGVRVADGVTLAVDLGARFATFKAATETFDTGSRIVIDIAGRPIETAAPPAPPPPAVSELPAFGRPSTRLGTIVIDPGHGGSDTGVKSATGTLEKDLALTMARRLKGALESKLGIRVLLTRDDDRALPLDERAAIANSNKADFFISLHANASFKPSVQGASLHIARFSEEEQARARTTPARLAVFGGGQRDITPSLWDLAQIAFLPQSIDAAKLLAAELSGRVPLVDPPLVHASFRVLESANMPAVLVEMGYLSNPEQEAQLVSNDFQATLTQALMDGLIRFRDALTPPGGER
jgi:N-acetylmuramoyl-L-alanine amidase